MGGRLFLGNQMISPVIIQGEEKVFNVDGYDWLGEINAQGVLVAPTKDLNPVFDGVKTINSSILRSKFKNDSRVKSVGFPDLETISGSLEETFYHCPITEINLPKLKTISSNNALAYIFGGCPITSISVPELETVSGDLALSGTFSGAQIESVSFPKLTSTSGYQVMGGMFSNCSKLKSAYFPALEYINSDGGSNFVFNSCPLLENVDLSSLSEVDDAGLAGFFLNCTNLKTITFTSLAEIGYDGLVQCFASSGIETIYFPSLTTPSDSYCFYGMLDGCSNVTVHFPVALESVIGEWDDVLAGFDGTNTTVLFDL